LIEVSIPLATESADVEFLSSQELEALRSRLGKLKQSLLEKDKMHEDIQLRLSSQSESLSLAQTECQTLRKQVWCVSSMFITLAYPPDMTNNVLCWEQE